MLKKAANALHFDSATHKNRFEKNDGHPYKKKRLAYLAGESARLTSRIYATGCVVMPVQSKAL